MLMPIALIASLLSTLPTAAGFHRADPDRARARPAGTCASHAWLAEIISYTRWPDEPVTATRLCVMGKAAVLRSAGRRGAGRADAPSRSLIWRMASPQSPRAADVLYLGVLAAGARQRAIASIRGRGVLSIAESDPACRGGTMFCLDIDSRELSFRLSLDAISRGTVRVDPRVLRLSDTNEDEIVSGARPPLPTLRAVLARVHFRVTLFGGRHGRADGAACRLRDDRRLCPAEPAPDRRSRPAIPWRRLPSSSTIPTRRAKAWRRLPLEGVAEITVVTTRAGAPLRPGSADGQNHRGCARHRRTDRAAGLPSDRHRRRWSIAASRSVKCGFAEIPRSSPVSYPQRRWRVPWPA